MNDKSLPWNFQVVFQLPPQTYHTTFNLRPSNAVPDVEKRLDAMTEYSDALAVISRIKDL